MPTYDYRCANEHVFEVFQKMSDPPKASCPECGEAAIRMVSGGTGFLSRGGGGTTGASSRGRTLDGGSSAGEPPHAPKDRTFGV